MSDQGKPTTVIAEPERPGLFQAFGVEIEAMIVTTAGFDVAPVCDRLMERVSGGREPEVEFGDVAWSNELTLHVLEVKTNGPAPSLVGLGASLHDSLMRADGELRPLGARLLPGAVHPWMDPDRETRLWPHEYTDVYRTFDRIFGCRGHGWANLQSTHLNLPFADDEEFGRLHAAIRLVLPIIPALSAGSPYLDGRLQDHLDARLVAYRGNAARVPSVSGLVVPDPAADRAAYERDILQPIYADLESLDPEGVLRHEWVNARGAIARFDRGAIEIRVIDAQECPAADLAVLGAVTAAVRALTEGALASRDVGRDPSTERLAAIMDAVVRDAEQARVVDPDYLRILGMRGQDASAGEIWRDLLDRFPPSEFDPLWEEPLDRVLSTGPLARRMVREAGTAPGPAGLRRLAERMAGCLEANRVL